MGCSSNITQRTRWKVLVVPYVVSTYNVAVVVTVVFSLTNM